MDTPAYQVTVTHLSAGWTYAVMHGTPAAAGARTVVADPLTYSWGWDGEQVPGKLVPSSVKLSLWSRTTADDPQPERGDLLSVVVRLNGTNTGPILLNQTMRVTDVSDELRPDQEWAVRSVVTLVDLLADLPSLPVFKPAYDSNTLVSTAHEYRRRFAGAGRAIGRTIACPSTWATTQGTGTQLSSFWPAVDAAAFCASLLASHQPAGIAHVVCPAPQGAVPFGYQFVGPTDHYLDPNSAVKYLLVPADRRGSAVTPQPLRLVVAGGLVTTAAQPAAVAARTAALDAGWCDVPASARRGREHVTNVLELSGVETAAQLVAGVTNERNGKDTRQSPDAAARGPMGRKLDTQLQLRTYDTNDTTVTTQSAAQATAVGAVAATYLSDATVLDASWQFDSFTLHAAAMPQADAESILPKLVPLYPGSGGDGVILRHVTVHRLAPSVRFAGQPVSGFVASGSLRIAGGVIDVQVTTTPGRPTGAGLSPAVTVGDAQASATWGAQTTATVDTRVTVADLDYIGA